MRNVVVLLLSLSILGACGICDAGELKGGLRGAPGRGHEGGPKGVTKSEHHDMPQGELTMNYYNQKCPAGVKVEDIVRDIVWNNVSANPNLPAKLLRLHYHDCFVRGCDGSVLLDSTPTNSGEKDAIPNRSLGGFDIIDLIKDKLEEQCPGVVSCADILALAARDAVSVQFGKPLWQVFTGREDGRVSSASEAAAGLPSPFANFTALTNNFQSNGLDIVDLVALSGAHTIGITHCSLMAIRLYNFTGKGDTDPDLNPDYVKTLKGICPPPVNPTTTVEMDPGSSTSFDSHYFVNLNQEKGAFLSDAALLKDPRSAFIARLFQNPTPFFAQFAQSMRKMGAIRVLTNGQGEIRKKCRFVD